MAEYPKRDPYFAHRTFRLMTKVCAAQEIGSDAMLLVAVVLHQEDAKRYRSPVSFYNGQLIPILGFTSWNRLNTARKAAVEFGWLHYESGGKGKPGLYWGMIPKHASDVDDSPIDEGLPYTSIVESGGASGDASGDDPVSIVESGGASGGQVGCKWGASGAQIGDKCGAKLIKQSIKSECGETPLLSPKVLSPIPKKPVKKKAGVLSLVSEEILADPKRVLDWFKQASKGKGKVLEPTETNKRYVVHTAQRVLRDEQVENPVGCFVDCVKKQNFKLTNTEEDRAIAAIKLIERGPPAERTSESHKSKSKEQQLREAREWEATIEKEKN